MKRLFSMLLCFFLCIAAAGCTERSASVSANRTLPAVTASSSPVLAEDGSYDTKEEVAEYLIAYGHLPDN